MAQSDAARKELVNGKLLLAVFLAALATLACGPAAFHRKH